MKQVNDIYEQLRAFNSTEFENCRFDSAYHSLASALHFAQAVENVEWLNEISATAKSQQGEIDEKHPDYKHSSPSALNRGHVGLFTALAGTAESAALLIHASSQTDRAVTNAAVQHHPMSN